MARLYVLAGTNGAGKSSVVGALLFGSAASHFDPDAVAAELRSLDPTISIEEANAEAWHTGVRVLRRAIAEDLDLMLETTLGGTTITGILEEAARNGQEVRVIFVGLADVELHIARVAARVARGGHDIPETRIRERFDRGRENAIHLLPHVSELRLIDNSADADPTQGRRPKPKLVLHMIDGELVAMCDPVEVPNWAKPIVASAIGLAASSRPLELPGTDGSVTG